MSSSSSTSSNSVIKSACVPSDGSEGRERPIPGRPTTPAIHDGEGSWCHKGTLGGRSSPRSADSQESARWTAPDRNEGSRGRERRSSGLLGGCQTLPGADLASLPYFRKQAPSLKTPSRTLFPWHTGWSFKALFVDPMGFQGSRAASMPASVDPSPYGERLSGQESSATEHNQGVAAPRTREAEPCLLEC